MGRRREERRGSKRQGEGGGNGREGQEERMGEWGGEGREQKGDERVKERGRVEAMGGEERKEISSQVYIINFAHT